MEIADCKSACFPKLRNVKVTERAMTKGLSNITILKVRKALPIMAEKFNAAGVTLDVQIRQNYDPDFICEFGNEQGRNTCALHTGCVCRVVCLCETLVSRTYEFGPKGGPKRVN